ncbi:MAG TPA: HlyD family type I secretion periplasmic adaptor subunit, partial [Alphaproteobacteria bacterium]
MAMDWNKIKHFLLPLPDEDTREDIDFMTDVEAAIRRSGSQMAFITTLAAAGVIVLFIIWAQFATLDEVTKGEGQVIASSRTQVIQSLEGGIVSEILIQEGQMVEKDQVLLKIDNVTAEATLKEKEARYYFLKGSIARLVAQIEDKPLDFPEELKKNAPSVVTDQIAQYNLKKSQQQAELSVLESQVSQRSQEVNEMRSRLNQLNGNLQVKVEELNMTSPMVAQGIMPKVDLLRIEGQVTDLRGEIRTIQTSIPRAQTAVSEANQRISEVKAKGKAEASTELGAAKAELDSLGNVLTVGQDKVQRTQMRSPVKGTVKQLKINSIGGVIKPGEDVIEIVPAGDKLLVEARVRPADIAFILPGQKAMVKITAYDFSIYGGLVGKVQEISADTIQDPKGESFYRVKIRTDKTTIEHRGKVLPIIPGMMAQVNILTGEKSVWAYLMKP